MCISQFYLVLKMQENFKAICGNSLDVLKQYPDNYFDSVVTDPPYGLGDNLYKRVNKVVWKSFNIMLPNFVESNIKRIQYRDFSSISGLCSDLSRCETVPIIKSGIAMPESSINFDGNIEVRQIEVNGCTISSSFDISDSVLVNKIDSSGSKFIGNYIFDFGDSVDFTADNFFSGNFGEFSSGFFSVPIRSIFSSCFPDSESDFPFPIFRDGVFDVVWCSNNVRNNSVGHSFALTEYGAEDIPMLTFNFTGATTDINATITTCNSNAFVDFLRPKLVRTSLAASSLSTMLQPIRVSMILNSADGTVSDYFFHLYVPKNMLNDISRIYNNASGFMGKKWDYDVPSVEIWKEVFRVLKPGGHVLSFAGTRTQHRMAVNIEDAGFEIRDMIAWVYGCYSEDTECLTNNGWKRYSDINRKDSILQWDYKTDNFSWYIPTELYVYDAPKEMIHIKNRHTNQILTPNHRVYLKHKTNSRYNYGEWDVVSAENVKKSWLKVFPLASKLDSGVSIKHAYMIGWWMTDAWMHSDGKACMFSQAKSKTLDKLKNSLQNSPCKFSEYVKKSKKETHNDEHTFYVTGELAEYLINNFPTRNLTFDVLSWDYKSRFDLLEGLLDGDGSRREGNHVETFWSKKTDRLDIVSALCTSLGIRNHVDYKKGCVYLNRNKRTTELQSKHTVEKIEYSGEKVWCLKTETGAFVVRRNGKPFISGNSGFPKSLDVSKAIDKSAGAVREVVGKNLNYHSEGKRSGTGKSQFGVDDGSYSNPDSASVITAPATDEAKKWQGWGTALKPALEPITVARKPLIGTVVDNVLTHGTGVLNIDRCRVALAETEDVEKLNARSGGNRGFSDSEIYGTSKGVGSGCDLSKGRWPANFIHDGSDDVLAGFPAKAGAAAPVKGSEASNPAKNTYGEYGRVAGAFHGDTGSAARFFYCAKANKKDREDGNNHPTVKPTDLMRYLCRLVTPPNGIVLDPFMGSGSTGKAAMLEGFQFVGIDLSEEYVKIANARIANTSKPNKKTQKTVVESISDQQTEIGGLDIEI